ncbi:hypothetical protein [Desulfobacula toluolica]|uniref:Conserved uncharacterized protein n=1 Tax=Desulfobacula toluolica (strain DSM 7467 / Tol2) TaxID=651182 RepID=K0NMH5_DESTT|nr:hypothetical protein [Desulfobacula toluolica]CCK79907.1 conserved uncharacterized protein [Desulfobacula toluolica Tol2]
MSIKLKLLFSFLMIIALVFGFVHIYFPADNYSFERLHIFLFNLCTGGTILLYYTQGKETVSKTVWFFFSGSLIYAFSAFLKLYPITILVSIILFVLVEKIRTDKFSFLPFLFFKPGEPVSEKFHQASLLCLSCGLVIATLVILNNEYFNFVNMEKLTLNTFFLGFSFPLSLISLSVVFSMLKKIEASWVKLLMELCFWTITLGVIIFFVFILFERFIPQVFVTSALFVAVVTVFYLYSKFADKIQQKLFLTSGIGFLIFTAITGIAYIFLQMSEGYDPLKTKWLIHMHVFASLYGWNLCGLSVICRFDDFPIKLHSATVICIHWLTAVVLAPLGVFYGWFAIFAIIGYSFITLTLFFSSNKRKTADE